MPYVIECNDGGWPYGLFHDEGVAERYAGMLDLDPACTETAHEVRYEEGYRSPMSLDELRKVVTERIIIKHHGEEAR